MMIPSCIIYTYDDGCGDDGIVDVDVAQITFRMSCSAPVKPCCTLPREDALLPLLCFLMLIGLSDCDERPQGPVKAHRALSWIVPHSTQRRCNYSPP